MLRTSAVVVGARPNAERGPSDTVDTATPVKSLGPLHSNPYPHTASPGQPNECEAGNEPYITDRAVIGNVPGTQAADSEEASLP